MVTKAHLRGNKKYLEKFEDIKIRVPLGRRETLHALAAAQGKSLNQYVVDAIDAVEDKQDDSARTWDSTCRKQSAVISNDSEKAD
jgi:hypothetical protein